MCDSWARISFHRNDGLVCHAFLPRLHERGRDFGTKPSCAAGCRANMCSSRRYLRLPSRRSLDSYATTVRLAPNPCCATRLTPCAVCRELPLDTRLSITVQVSHVTISPRLIYWAHDPRRRPLFSVGIHGLRVSIRESDTARHTPQPPPTDSNAAPLAQRLKAYVPSFAVRCVLATVGLVRLEWHGVSVRLSPIGDTPGAFLAAQVRGLCACAWLPA